MLICRDCLLLDRFPLTNHLAVYQARSFDSFQKTHKEPLAIECAKFHSAKKALKQLRRKMDNARGFHNPEADETIKLHLTENCLDCFCHRLYRGEKKSFFPRKNCFHINILITVVTRSPNAHTCVARFLLNYHLFCIFVEPSQSRTPAAPKDFSWIDLIVSACAHLVSLCFSLSSCDFISSRNMVVV